jgi:hypothetical protein
MLVIAVIPLIFAALIATKSYAETSPSPALMSATTLICTFTSEQQTRWGTTGPIKEEGNNNNQVTFALINHQAGEAKRLFQKRYVWQDEYEPVKIRTFTHSITFFELTKSGQLDPVITTVLDDYYSGTTQYIAVRSSHVTSAFQRALAIQELGTCVTK